MSQHIREWLRGHPVWADVALAVSLYALWLVGSVIAGPAAGHRPTWLDAAVSAVAVAPVMVRRVSPWLAVVLLGGVVVASAVLDRSAGAESLSFLVVSYTAAAMLTLRHAVAAFAVITVSVAASLFVDRPPELLSVSFSNALVLAVCFFLGRTVQTRRAYTDALEDRARAAEATREAVAREAVLDERRRIARELHDVVAHHISVMGVLATGARRTLYRDPATADDTLKTIEETGRSTLREMRRLLDVLRVEEDAPDAPVEPQPGVARLETLAEQLRDAGLAVDLTLTGDAVTLDPGVDLTVYRIVQEALTNVLKHAGRATARVVVSFTADSVDLEVSDDGRGPRPADESRPDGHGLVGMRERVSLYGGRLHTGPRAAGGFLVRARIPLETTAAECP